MKTLRKEDAVSPVIGVVLMVAITVILAAVITAAMFGLTSPNQNAPPMVQLKASIYDGGSNDYVIIEHLAGDALKRDEIKLVVRDEDYNKYPTDNWTEDLLPGQKIKIKGNLGKDGEKRSIRIVHIPSNTVLYDRMEIISISSV